jgi:hypothetical protein
MKNVRALVALSLLAVFLAGEAHANTSSINPNVPAQNSPLSSAVLRGNFGGAYNDENTIYGVLSLASNQLLGTINAGNAGPLNLPSCPLGGLSWTPGSGFGCTNIAGILSPVTNNLIFTGIDAFNLNANTLPTKQTGTVVQFGDADTITSRIELDAFAAPAHFSGIRSDGTNAAPTTLQSLDEIASFNSFGYNGSAIVGPRAAIRTYAAQNWTSGNNGTYVDIATAPDGTTSLAEVIKFENDGGIDTPSAAGGDKGPGTINVAGAYGTYFALTATGSIPSGGTGVYSTAANAISLSTSGTAALTLSAAQAATFAGTLAVNGFVTVNAGASSTPSALTISGSSVTTNAALSNYFYVTLSHTATTTISNPTNPTDGQNLAYEFTQDSTGSNLVSWGSAFDFGASGSPTISTTAAKVDIIGFKYSNRLSKWVYLGAQLGN